MSTFELRPVVTATAEHRKASSDCCGAGLALTCRACGQECGRVLGDPEQVTISGEAVTGHG